MTLISDANFRGRSLFLPGSHVTAAFCAHSSTSREGHGGKAQFKSEIIIQTALWGSLMTKVSLRCGYNSALEYQLGLSGTWSRKEVTGIVNACRLSVGTWSTHYAL